MRIKELKKIINEIDDNAEVLFSSDEEFNCLRSCGDIAELSDRKNTYVIYGFDGTEVE